MKSTSKKKDSQATLDLEKFGVEVDPSRFTPLIKQYLEIKEQNPDAILMFRIGDFYEMFFADAKTASQELQLFLTRKAAGDGIKIPMCGIPHHAYLTYAQKLLDNGHKVAIVEQLEDPRTAKKLVKRGVIQIITPGANLDLKTDDNNFIAAAELTREACALAYADMSTGEIYATNLAPSPRSILSKLLSLDIKELVVSTTCDARLIQIVKENSRICVSYCNSSEPSLDMVPILEPVKDPRQIAAVARLMNYLTETQKRELNYFERARVIVSSETLKLDYSTEVNLELIKSADGKRTFGTLYWLLNRCSTPMGSRYLRTSISEPLAKREAIEERQDAVDWLIDNYIAREDLARALSGVYDLDRLIARISYGQSNGHDMLQLKRSLSAVPEIRKLIPRDSGKLLTSLADRMSNFDQLTDLLERAVREDAPLTITEGGIFKEGYDEELDRIVASSSDSKNWVAELENREKERTGIRNLRVGFNRAFGYYIEVSKSSLPDVKPEFGYIRKQTLTTGERFTTAELQERETLILRGDEMRASREYALFQELREKVSGYTADIQALSGAIAQLDFLISCSSVCAERGYCRPQFSTDRTVRVVQARHPVIEKAQPEREFVANDYTVDAGTEVLIITGPNMGGKSTYMREFAILVIMAQMGIRVPAESCTIPIFDAIFTRIGASDDLIKGSSTFMVEMQETNRALREASSSSLILFDEIGRGTATYDGMALAQAILEYDISRVHALTLFSTHYHELTAMAERYPQMRNVHVSVSESDGKITFLYRVQDGPMDRSYGINVAQLAGLPDSLIERAEDILAALERDGNRGENVPKIHVERAEKKRSKVEDEIAALDPLNMSPLEALQTLYRLKGEVDDR